MVQPVADGDSPEFGYQFKSWSSKLVEIQIDFEIPAMVSRSDMADDLEVIILKPEVFIIKGTNETLKKRFT